MNRILGDFPNAEAASAKVRNERKRISVDNLCMRKIEIHKEIRCAGKGITISIMVLYRMVEIVVLFTFNLCASRWIPYDCRFCSVFND